MSEARGDGRSERELAQQLQAVRGAGRRRRWPLLAAGVVVGVLAVLIVLALTGDGDGDETDTATEGLLAVEQVTTRDLVSFRTYDGVLGFGEPSAVAAPVDGVVTRVPAPDTEIVRGDVVVELDGVPVVAFQGDSPLYRDIGPGTGAGDDVLLVEENLAVLGFDADGTLVVDGWYDAATEQAVTDWQEAVGREADGTLDRGAVVVIEGPVRVADAPVLGASARAGVDLVSLTLLSETATLSVPPPDPPEPVDEESETTDEETTGDAEEVEAPEAEARTSAGLVGSVPAIGTPVTDGATVYTVADRPVVALVDPDEVGRALVSGDDDAVQRALTRAGLADTAAWAAARSLGVDPASATFVEVPAGAAVAEVFVVAGTDVALGDPILEVRATTQRVEVDLPVDDLDELVVGDEVEVELPDGVVVPAVVASRNSVAELATGTQAQPVTTIEVRVELTAEPESSITEGPVTVRAVDEEVIGAVVVPVRALLSLAEGGFGVEVVGDGGLTRLVGIETGKFSDGLVEITNGAVAPGDAVVVPG